MLIYDVLDRPFFPNSAYLQHNTMKNFKGCREERSTQCSQNLCQKSFGFVENLRCYYIYSSQYNEFQKKRSASEETIEKLIRSLFHLLTFRRRIKSRLPFAGIIRRLSYSTRFQDKG